MTQEFVTLPREVVEQAQMWIPLLAEIAGLDPEKTAAEFSEFADGRPASEFTIAGVITALRAALEQPQVEQEPFVWLDINFGDVWKKDAIALYGKPVGAIPLYTHLQPKREPLTDDWIEKICPSFDDPMRREMWKIGFKAAHNIK